MKVEGVVEGMPLAKHGQVTQAVVASNEEVQVGVCFAPDVGKCNGAGERGARIFVEYGALERNGRFGGRVRLAEYECGRTSLIL